MWTFAAHWDSDKLRSSRAGAPATGLLKWHCAQAWVRSIQRPTLGAIRQQEAEIRIVEDAPLFRVFFYLYILCGSTFCVGRARFTS